MNSVKIQAHGLTAVQGSPIKMLKQINSMAVVFSKNNFKKSTA